MNAPTDETQGKMRPTQLGMTTACHFQTCSQIPCFICNRKNSLLFPEPFGTMFSIHLQARRQSAACMPSNDKRMAVETSSLGGKNEMLQSVNARSRESWRRDKNVSIHANWCPDPPPGCHCLLSGGKIKGPSVFKSFPGSAFVPLHVAPSPFGSAAIPRRCWEGSLPAGVPPEQEADSVSLRWAWRCQSAHSQLVLQSRGEGHVEFRALAMTDGCEGNLLSAAYSSSPGFAGCEWAGARTGEERNRRFWSYFIGTSA